MRWFAGAAVAVLFPMVAYAAEIPVKCDQAAFATVVSEASAQLTALNDASKKSFHGKLQALKSREGWSDADFVAKATPFVKDENIAAFDDANKALLAKVPQLGGPSTVTASIAAFPGADNQDAKHCAMLGELRGLMTQVIENTRAKWAYMLGKIDTAGVSVDSTARQAQAGR
jgi:hypothetical protein